MSKLNKLTAVAAAATLAFSSMAVASGSYFSKFKGPEGSYSIISLATLLNGNTPLTPASDTKVLVTFDKAGSSFTLSLPNAVSENAGAGTAGSEVHGTWKVVKKLGYHKVKIKLVGKNIISLDNGTAILGAPLFCPTAVPGSVTATCFGNLEAELIYNRKTDSFESVNFDGSGCEGPANLGSYSSDGTGSFQIVCTKGGNRIK